MALYKEIRQEDGVMTKYHRILFIQKTINKQNSIAILSYADEYSRESEKESAENRPYKKSITYEVDYDEKMTVESAYGWLKTLPEFEGSEDI